MNPSDPEDISNLFKSLQLERIVNMYQLDYRDKGTKRILFPAPFTFRLFIPPLLHNSEHTLREVLSALFHIHDVTGTRHWPMLPCETDERERIAPFLQLGQHSQSRSLKLFFHSVSKVHIKNFFKYDIINNT